jgi:hypothetical protein
MEDKSGAVSSFLVLLEIILIAFFLILDMGLMLFLLAQLGSTYIGWECINAK